MTTQRDISVKDPGLPHSRTLKTGEVAAGIFSGQFRGQVTAYAADGAIDPTDSLAVCTTPCDAVSLAAGASGHVISIKSISGTADNLVLTPASFNDGTTITFDADDEYAMLQSDGTSWYVISTNATVG